MNSYSYRRKEFSGTSVILTSVDEDLATPITIEMIKLGRLNSSLLVDNIYPWELPFVITKTFSFTPLYLLKLEVLIESGTQIEGNRKIKELFILEHLYADPFLSGPFTDPLYSTLYSELAVFIIKTKLDEFYAPS